MNKVYESAFPFRRVCSNFYNRKQHILLSSFDVFKNCMSSANRNKTLNDPEGGQGALNQVYFKKLDNSFKIHHGHFRSTHTRTLMKNNQYSFDHNKCLLLFYLDLAFLRTPIYAKTYLNLQE